MKNAISAGHKQTLEAAKEILLAGGNAFDAVIAAHFAMFITEPSMASAGGNGFALLKAKDSAPVFYDYFSQTPSIKKDITPDFHPIIVDFGNAQEKYNIGLATASVPGTIAGLYAMHEKYASMPMIELVQPAISLAKSGVKLNSFVAYYIYLLKDILSRSKEGKRIFFNKNKIKEEGDLIKMDLMADFLDYISKEGKDAFYKGEIAHKIAKDSKDNGGFLTREDFETYKVLRSEPFKISYRNKTVFLPNASNLGGANLAIFLAQEKTDPESIAYAIENSLKISTSPEDKLDFLAKAYPGNNYYPELGKSAFSGTTHINISDKKGNAVSLSTSIGEGSGYFIPGTDMQLNNMLGETYLLPDGKHSWIPKQRLSSMMTPTILSNHLDQLEFIGGSGGAGRIPFAIGQVLNHLYSSDMELEKAIEESRYHFQNDHYQVEAGASWNSNKENVILWDKKSLYFGGVHAIQFMDDHVKAYGDPRRAGVADVF